MNLRLIYALHNKKYTTAEQAALARDWVYVGKNDITVTSTVGQTLLLGVTLQTTLNEHLTQKTSRHGVLCENAIIKSNFNVTISKLDQRELTILETGDNSNPTSDELKWIDKLEKMGANIKNTKQ